MTPFATIPSEIEEVRCRPSPGAHGWPAGVVYCHAPHGIVYRLAADGTRRVFATLPENDKQDGVMAFDTAGHYGFAMLVTTGGPNGDGGTVYALGPDAAAAVVGTFAGAGRRRQPRAGAGAVRHRRRTSSCSRSTTTTAPARPRAACSR